MDYNPLTVIFTNAFGFINRYPVYECLKKWLSPFVILYIFERRDKTVFVRLNRAKAVYRFLNNNFGYLLCVDL